MPVVTLSREVGSGAGHIGRRTAECLKVDYLDSGLCDETARRLNVPAQVVHRLDEKREGLILRLLRSLQVTHPEMAVESPAVQEAIQAAPEPDHIWETVQEVIREEARSGNCVVVGRGGAFILAGWPGVRHVRLVAPLEWRVDRVATLQKVPMEEAARRVDLADREREAFLRYRFGVDPRDPHHFDLVLNTKTLGLEEAIRLIVSLASGSGS